MHIYLSVGQRNASGALVNPKTGQPTNKMRWRGEAGPNDDPASFKRLMESRGHVVHFHDDRPGEPNAKGQIEYDLED